MTITAPSDLSSPVKESMLSPTIHVLIDRCAGCQECIVRCPTQALHMDPVTWTAVGDDQLCVGCRQCERTCPYSAIFVDGPQLVAARVSLETVHPDQLTFDRSETRRAITNWHEALDEASRCLDCPDPTCVRGCPAHNDIPGFIRALRSGDLDEAHKVLRRTTYLPDICSRVCDQAVQCEGSCSWSLAGSSPVAIGALERFIADNAPVPPIEVAEAAKTDRAPRVAIVGSGPAGIAAAATLRAGGADVTVFERDSTPGGLLIWGIPDFTLPEQVARRPWEHLLEAGVHLHTNHNVNAEELKSLADDFDAVVVAAGASVAMRAPVPGSDLEGVCDATEFLQAARLAIASGTPMAALAPKALSASAPADTRPARVLVLGAGNTAMDVARSARRLGAQATCIDWMDRRFAPVRPDELDEATTEGVEVRFSTTLRRLLGEDGHVSEAELAETVQHKASKRPKVLESKTSRIQVDMVVMAMGYRIDSDIAKLGGDVPVAKKTQGFPDRRWLASGLLANPAPPAARYQPVGLLALGREKGEAQAAYPRGKHTWFAGDSLVGPSTVVEAMAQGKVAAAAILASLSPGEPDGRR
jgi:glutamate synthase (NADPH/NADH) small chain